MNKFKYYLAYTFVLLFSISNIGNIQAQKYEYKGKAMAGKKKFKKKCSCYVVASEYTVTRYNSEYHFTWTGDCDENGFVNGEGVLRLYKKEKKKSIEVMIFEGNYQNGFRKGEGRSTCKTGNYSYFYEGYFKDKDLKFKGVQKDRYGEFVRGGNWFRGLFQKVDFNKMLKNKREKHGYVVIDNTDYKYTSDGHMRVPLSESYKRNSKEKIPMMPRSNKFVLKTNSVQEAKIFIEDVTSLFSPEEIETINYNMSQTRIELLGWTGTSFLKKDRSEMTNSEKKNKLEKALSYQYIKFTFGSPIVKEKGRNFDTVSSEELITILFPISNCQFEKTGKPEESTTTYIDWGKSYVETITELPMIFQCSSVSASEIEELSNLIVEKFEKYAKIKNYYEGVEYGGGDGYYMTDGEFIAYSHRFDPPIRIYSDPLIPKL